MITVVFDNCGAIIREYQQCVRWPWSRCKHFDIASDALRDPTSIHTGRGEPKCVSFLVFRVQLVCILAEQKLFCCNRQDHGSAQQQRAMDAVARLEEDST
jgi:hypothetical protein